MTESLKIAVKRFNKVMENCEDLNVLKINEDGTLVAYHDPDFRPKGIPDLIKETKYQLSLYYENGHALNDLLYKDSKTWRSKVGMLKRLIRFLKTLNQEI